MLRPFDMVLIGILIAGASWTFKVKHDAELAMQRVRVIEREIAREKNEIDLLKADWALLTSPERLERLAKIYQEQLGLQELDPGQVSTIDELPPIKPPPGEDDFANVPAGEDNTLTGGVTSDDADEAQKTNETGQ